MARIAPFRGIRYDATRFPGEDVSLVIAPPYDVLSEADRDALLARHDRNIVAIDLPHVPPGSAGPPEAYARSADLLRAWLDDGTLVHDERPALYVYHQRFTHGGRPIVRRKFFTRLRLEPFGAGTVFPHEQTFGGPKQDRLMLTRSTRCNLSPIFGIYPDAENRLTTILDVTDRPPVCHGEIDGVESTLWVVDDAATIDRAAEAMADRAVFIADGHHRYGTALMYRDELVGDAGALPEDHPANFVLVVLCAMEDDGLLILPTHRLLMGLEADRALDAVRSADGVRLEPVSADANDPIPTGSFRVYDGVTDRTWALSIDGPRMLAALEPDRSDAWRRLDLAALHRYLIDEILAPLSAGGPQLEVRYVKDATEGRRQARERSALLVETAPTSLRGLGDVCRAGELMPPKSTYFYPKLATGLLIHSLTD